MNEYRRSRKNTLNFTNWMRRGSKTNRNEKPKRHVSAFFQHGPYLAMDKLTLLNRRVVCLLVAIWVTRLRQGRAGEVRSHSNSRLPSWKEGSCPRGTVTVHAWRKSSASRRQELSSEQADFPPSRCFSPSV